LEGHLAIPHVVAYGHLQHLEYLAMELLGKSLEAVAPMDERTVVKIAMHLVSSTRSYVTFNVILTPHSFPRLSLFTRVV
jgi:hypothetical protein